MHLPQGLQVSEPGLPVSRPEPGRQALVPERGQPALPGQLEPGLVLPESQELRQVPALRGQPALQPVPERVLRALVQVRPVPERFVPMQPVLQSSPD